MNKLIGLLIITISAYAGAQTTKAKLPGALKKQAAVERKTNSKNLLKKNTSQLDEQASTEAPKTELQGELIDNSGSRTVAAASSQVVQAAEGTSTANGVAKASPAKKFSGSFVVAAYAMVNDLKDNGSSALVDSENSLTGLYAVTETIKVGASHNFGMRVISDRSQLADYNSDNGSESIYKTLDPTLHFNYKMAPLLGSNAYAILSRYYVPVAEDSRKKSSHGTLRTQAYITWSMNPKIDISFFGQVRLYMNSSNNTDTALGSDSVLRTIVGPVFGYNFTDVWNVYYNPYIDLRSAGFQRGQFDADRVNNFNQELGVWISIAGGKYVINPAWATSSSKFGKSTYEGSGDDVNSEYDLNLIASF